MDNEIRTLKEKIIELNVIIENLRNKISEFESKQPPIKSANEQFCELYKNFSKKKIIPHEIDMIVGMYLTKQDQNYLKEIIDKINQKFSEKKIKAREMPDIHYLIVYKISEEKFLDENISKIKNYFEDYLKQVKEAEELAKEKKKMEEEAKLKEQKEKEKRERIILPKINNFELVEIKENKIVILVPLFEEKEIINKNKNNITNCFEKLGK